MRFVLIHGACHGAWCWEQFTPSLEARGHEAIAVELPGHGERRDETASLDAYRDAVVEVLAPGDVLVGHSLGSVVAVLAADAFLDIGHIVLLAGPLPIEGQPIAGSGSGNKDSADAKIMPGRDDGPDQYIKVSDDGQSHWFEFEGARECFYHDCSIETAQWAYDHLTPQSTSVLMGERVSVSRFWLANLPRSYIVCTDDRAMPLDMAKQSARRLGVKPFEIATSHSPFLSKPEELADLVVKATYSTPYSAPVPT